MPYREQARLLSPAKAYGVAVLATAVVVVCRLVLYAVGFDQLGRSLLFPTAIVIAAWVGGFGPGLLASALTTVAILFILIEPRFSWAIADRRDIVELVAFFGQGLFISVLGGAFHRSRQATAKAYWEQERKVEERTLELSRVNQALRDQAAEREHDRQRLLRYARRLDQSNQELQDFASVASHDLQEPLRKIRAFGGRLAARAEGGLDEAGRDYLARMLNAAERMQVLITDLLSFSRITTKARPFEPVDLNRVAAEVVSDLEARIEQVGGKVDLDFLPTLDADPLQMRQLLQNLIANALKFARPGMAPHVRVYAELAAEETDTGAAREVMRLHVEDNGIGFDEKYLDRIFNVFQRLHGRGEYEGTGIGLAVCRKIAVRHGGEVTARSRPGEGSTFIVTLPLQHSSTSHASGHAGETHYDLGGR